ncbi:MAG: hypothetical protein QME46_11200 [Thermoanaerobacteraceae bacterium]|nr:hypothetical protein [Thermoanaerobacteraceae bacterium]
MRRGEVLKLGLIPYLKGKEIQLAAMESVKSGETDGVLIILQHPPVYTIGSAGGFDNILIPPSNVNTDLSYFNLINPCGITDFGVTSLNKLGIDEDILKVRERMIDRFKDVYDIGFEEISLDRLVANEDAKA